MVEEKMTESTPSSRYYFRLIPYHRVLHLMVIFSFLGLVMTGMPLKFSYTDWAVSLARFLGGFETARFAHRFFAVITFIYFMMHLGFIGHLVIVKKRKGIFWGPESMVPQPKDVKDLYQHFRWFIGLGAKPRFDRWTYWEKFDYWAVFWGVTVIGVSGLVMWFPELFTRLFPGWIINVALIVHSDEALLATGFIFTVHFFNTHFRPDKFPLDPVIFTGRVSEEELVKERPLEYQRLVQEGRLESLRADPPPAWMTNMARAIGFTALGLGLILVVLIVISLLSH
jgi:cytochrome b subunit of formate dehydrogenase